MLEGLDAEHGAGLSTGVSGRATRGGVWRMCGNASLDASGTRIGYSPLGFDTFLVIPDVAGSSPVIRPKFLAPLAGPGSYQARMAGLESLKGWQADSALRAAMALAGHSVLFAFGEWWASAGRTASGAVPRSGKPVPAFRAPRRGVPSSAPN